MNRLLFDEFKKLNELEKENLKEILKSSPTSFRLIDFLENCKSKSFNNIEVVKYLYKEELDRTEFVVLQNRYFKLRKKFIDESLQVKNSAPSIYTPEEMTFFEAIELLKTNPKQAKIILTDLEATLWKNNIFEMLPKVIDQLIYCNQLLYTINDNINLYKRYDEALRLLFFLHQVNSSMRRTHEVSFVNTKDSFLKAINLMKRIADKNRRYPRFALCYNYISLYNKLTLSEYFEQSNILSRHYSIVKEIAKKNPSLPFTTYKANYIDIQNHRINEITVYYHFNRGEFEDAYIAMKEVWKRLDPENPGAFVVTWGHFINMITICTAANRTNEALEVAQNMLTFFKENKQNQNLNIVYSLMLHIYIHGYPNIQMNCDYYLSKMGPYIKEQRKQNNNILLISGLTIKLQFSFLQNDYKSAKEVLQESELKDLYITYGMLSLVEEFIELASIKKHKMEDINNLLSKFSKQRFKVKDPNLSIDISWMIKMINLKKQEVQRLGNK